MREQDTRDGRPDHGPTQVRQVDELRVGDLYIYHYPIVGQSRTTMQVVQILDLPTQSKSHESIYPADTYTIPIRCFFKWHIKEPIGYRNVSLPDLGLAKYPGNPGEWDLDRWLEDPIKIGNGSSDLTQKEIMQIIRNRINS